MDIKSKIQMGKLGDHCSLWDSQLTEYDLEKARLELNETPEVRERLLQRFKEMLSEEKDFSAQTDDNYLLRFLRTRKFDLKRSYKLMRDYYKFRKANPGYFPNFPFQILEILKKTNIFDYAPYRDHMGRAIYHIKFGNWDTDKFSLNDFMAAGIMLTELVQDNPVTQINGIVSLWDFKGFGYKHFLNVCSPKAILNLKALMEECRPCRYKLTCIVNCHPLAIKALNVLKAFLKEKFRRRIHFFGTEDLKALHKIFDPCILPPEYGGNTEWNNQDIVKLLFDQEKYIQYTRSFGYKM